MSNTRSKLRTFLDSSRGYFATGSTLVVGFIGKHLTNNIENESGFDQNEVHEITTTAAEVSGIVNTVAIVGTGLTFGKNAFHAIKGGATLKEGLILVGFGVTGITTGIFACLNFSNSKLIVTNSTFAASSASTFTTGDMLARMIIARENIDVGTVNKKLMDETVRAAVSVGSLVGVAFASESMIEAIAKHPNSYAEFSRGGMKQSAALNYIVIASAGLQLVKEMWFDYCRDKVDLDVDLPYHERESRTKQESSRYAASVLFGLLGAGFSFMTMYNSDANTVVVKAGLSGVSASMFTAGALLLAKDNLEHSNPESRSILRV